MTHQPKPNDSKQRGDKARLFLFSFAVVEFIALVVAGGMIQDMRDNIQAGHKMLDEYAGVIEEYQDMAQEQYAYSDAVYSKGLEALYLNDTSGVAYHLGYRAGVADTVNSITLPPVIEVERTVVKVVERAVMIPPIWRDFESVEELASWMDVLSVTWIDGEVDCDDYSEYVWDMAYRSGYRMSEVLVWNGFYCGRHVTDGGVPNHIACQVQIDNSYYYFEPDPVDYRIIYICDRD